jgi:hypothetical protein
VLPVNVEAELRNLGKDGERGANRTKQFGNRIFG